MTATNNKNTIFDLIIGELTKKDSGTELLDQCMQFNYKLSRKVPLRYKIISVGFVRKYSLDELNANLQEYGLAKLYARNLWEASLLFVFRNGLSYKEWHELVDILTMIKRHVGLEDSILGQKNVSLKQLKEYVDQNSDIDSNAQYITKHQTRRFEEAISELKAPEEFIAYIRSNINEYSIVREKTRYYFCKYLYYYLERKIDSYLKISSMGIVYRPVDILNELSVFQGASKVKRSAMTPDDIRDFLENAPISCGVLYAEFNDFYFGYVSLNWMQILLEQAGDLEHLPVQSRKKLANAARCYDKKYKKLSDDQIIKKLSETLKKQDDALHEKATRKNDNPKKEEPLKGPSQKEDPFEFRELVNHKNREGEKVVRKYIKGILDLDRTTLICFLLFLASDLTDPERLFLDRKRLDIILKECGFNQLDLYNDFDYFVINFLDASEPSDYLMEEVTRYALSKENFYLYKLYLASRSDDTDIRNLLFSS